MKIYVASSWRNDRQPHVVAALREAGHVVYDFKKPEGQDDGFHWHDVGPNGKDWKAWTPLEFRDALNHPIARRGYTTDMNALQSADACVLVLPCGKSAHLELGYAAAAGKICFVLSETSHEPELMYAMCTPPYVLTSLQEVVENLRRQADALRPRLPGESADWVESKRRQTEGG